ncbi:MAG: UDP-N-acetylmuramoyl-tripeptide--D-alanyl-D-alanine ligase [Defluviitaleaceae bacterium]|nr:UDP-N-acetylmuramoyl-tripeptide--D-alanyl-D-alanine ligase [Defluviitaleaceae bacterium]
MNYTINEIAGAVNGCVECDAPEHSVFNVFTDSRDVTQGSLFAAIKGKNGDGHDFIDSAAQNGASAILCHISYSKPCSVPLIKVIDTKDALLALGTHYLHSISPTPVKVAITGSSGKTTTKDLVAAVLSTKFRTHKTPKSFNNDIGLPLTLFQMPVNTQAAVLEMGMNDLNEIAPLSAAVKPDIAIITTVGVAHIENLGSREGILHAKLEILEGISKSGLSIFNGDNDMLPTVKVPCRRILYGFGQNCGIRAEDIRPRGIHGISYTAVVGGKKIEIDVPMPGNHMVMNSLAAIAVATELGLSSADIQTGVASYLPTGNRMKITKIRTGATLMDDSYNANPESAKAVLDVLAHAEGRKVAVLGEMLELGDFAPEMHEDVGRYAAVLGIDVVVTVGELARHIHKGAAGAQAIHFNDKKSVAEWLNANLTNHDTVLVKASRGSRLEEITSEL